MNQPQQRGPLADMIMSRRENPGTGTGGAQALVNQMGQKPNMALPSSTPQANPVETQFNPSQIVQGKDGKPYHIVIDPKVGLQTFMPAKDQARLTNNVPGLGQMRGLGNRGRMGRVANMAQEGQGNQLMNRLRGMLSGNA